MMEERFLPFDYTKTERWQSNTFANQRQQLLQEKCEPTDGSIHAVDSKLL